MLTPSILVITGLNTKATAVALSDASWGHGAIQDNKDQPNSPSSSTFATLAGGIGVNHCDRGSVVAVFGTPERMPSLIAGPALAESPCAAFLTSDGTSQNGWPAALLNITG